MVTGLCMGDKDIPEQKQSETCGQLKTCCDVYSSDNILYNGCLADAYFDCCEEDGATETCCKFINEEHECSETNPCSTNEICEAVSGLCVPEEGSCCNDQTADCLSCSTGVPKEKYCQQFPTTSGCNKCKGQMAGEYEVWYRNAQRSTNMHIGCDNSAEQPGIFTDSLHFDNVKTKCSQSRDSFATMYILDTHGSGKYECLYQSDANTIKGNHYTGPNQFWGTIEYRLITSTFCDTCNY